MESSEVAELREEWEEVMEFEGVDLGKSPPTDKRLESLMDLCLKDVD